MQNHLEGDAPRRLAAIDLGSNSFHLLLASPLDGVLNIIEKRSDKVQLAAGLDKDNYLSEQAMDRALACLARFAADLKGIVSADIRVVGTNALRTAANSAEFIARAEHALGHPIEIIAGREEARLIYLGAAHALADLAPGRRLIVDIGGGSTELAIGEAFEPLALESLEMGCVTYTQRFFKNGCISEARMRAAENEALSELANIRQAYLTQGWDMPVGTSGTVEAAALVLGKMRLGDGNSLTAQGLAVLRQRLIECGHLGNIAMDGLKKERECIFPAGIAILSAIFAALELDIMHYTNGALRDGVLYDLLSRNTPQDARQLSVDALARRFDTDTRQAERIMRCAGNAFEQVRETWQLDEGDRQLLLWAARLHEIGRGISHARFHKHGDYLIVNTDLAGFSRPEQQALGFLVHAHRRRFPLEEASRLTAHYRQRCIRIARLLRLAVTLHRTRTEPAMAAFTLHAEGETLILSLSAQATPALLHDDLARESAYQREAGFELHINERC